MHVHEFGDPDGTPLVFFMGTPQKGESGAIFSELAHEYAIRLICPTRPWYDDLAVEPSFESCTAGTINYMRANQLGSCHVIGGSGGGPFALHFAATHNDVARSCYLLASMGSPDMFVEKVTSPPTLQLLELFRSNGYNEAMAQLQGWGLPRDLAHGAWCDFKVLLGQWPKMPTERVPRVYIHHGEGDDNAPIESIRDLARTLPQAELRISPYASHVALTEDEASTELTRIFREVAGH